MTSHPTQTTSPDLHATRPLGRRRRTILRALVITAVLIALALWWLYIALGYVPAFYRRAMKLQPDVLREGSDRMLRQTAALQSAVGKEGRWEALFTAEQINGWLAVDRAENHPNSLPPTMSDPRVAIDSQGIHIACRYDEGLIHCVLSLTVEPCALEPNVLALRIVKARAGRLPLPLGRVLDRISETARHLQLKLDWRPAGSDPVALFSMPESERGRIVRLDALRLGDGEIYIAGRTERKNP